MRCGKKMQLIYMGIEKMLARFCDKIICISIAEKQSALNKKICKEDKLKVIVNGVDIDAYDQRKAAGLNVVSRKKCNIPENAFIVGMVGRISEQKAPDIFIRAAKQIKKKIPEAYFMIIGDGSEREMIENYAEKNCLPLYITGWVENALDYVDLFDVALLLSRWEGFGLVLPEYMLAGKPIIACNVDAIPSIIADGENGLLVAVDSVDEVKNAVIKLYYESPLRIQLINKGRIIVRKKYDAKRVSQEHETMFLEMMN